MFYIVRFFIVVGLVVLVSGQPVLADAVDPPALAQFKSAIQRYNRQLLTLQKAHLPVEYHYRVGQTAHSYILWGRQNNRYLREDRIIPGQTDPPTVYEFLKGDEVRVFMPPHESVRETLDSFNVATSRVVPVAMDYTAGPDFKVIHIQDLDELDGHPVWVTEWMDNKVDFFLAFDRTTGFLVRDAGRDLKSNRLEDGTSLVDIAIGHDFSPDIFTDTIRGQPMLDAGRKAVAALSTRESAPFVVFLLSLVTTLPLAWKVWCRRGSDSMTSCIARVATLLTWVTGTFVLLVGVDPGYLFWIELVGMVFFGPVLFIFSRGQGTPGPGQEMLVVVCTLMVHVILATLTGLVAINLVARGRSSSAVRQIR